MKNANHSNPHTLQIEITPTIKKSPNSSISNERRVSPIPVYVLPSGFFYQIEFRHQIQGMLVRFHGGHFLFFVPPYNLHHLFFFLGLHDLK